MGQKLAAIGELNSFLLYNAMYTVYSYNTPQEQIRLIELFNNKGIICVQDILQVVVKSYGQHAYLQKMAYSCKSNTLSQVLCCRYYISMYLNEYLTKPWFSSKINLVTKISAPSKVLE